MPDSKSFAASATGRRLPRKSAANVGDRRIDELDLRIGREDRVELGARLDAVLGGLHVHGIRITRQTLKKYLLKLFAAGA